MQVFVGQKWVVSSPLWSGIVFSVKNQRFIAMSHSRLPTFQSRFAVLHTSTLIWSVPFHAHQDFRICLQSWTEQPAGQKRFRSPPSPPPTAQPPSSRDGSRGSAFQTQSPATGAHNSHLHCGPLFVPSSPSNTPRRQHTILSPTASWSGSTAD